MTLNLGAATGPLPGMGAPEAADAVGVGDVAESGTGAEAESGAESGAPAWAVTGAAGGTE